MEIWREIEGYNGDYLISNEGGVISNKGKESLNMKTGVNKRDGYEYIKLRKDGKYVHHKIHRLVAQHFIDNSDSNLVVNHIDGDKLNNNVNNLEWVTQSENIQHAYDTGLKTYSEKILPYLKMYNEKRKKKVVQLCIDMNEIINTYDSLHEASRKTGLGLSDLSKCCNRYRIKTLGGFKWRFEGEEQLKYLGRKNPNT